MKKKSLLILLMSLIALTIIAGCSEYQKKDGFLAPYLTQESISFSILVLSENNKFYEQTKELEDIYKAHIKYISKAGVIKEDSTEGSKLKDYLKIDAFPSYILLDNKKVLLVSRTIEDFKIKSKQIMEEVYYK